MEVKFTKADGAEVVENYDGYSVDSTARNTHHDVVLWNNGEDGLAEPDHKHRHRIVTDIEAQNAGSPRYAHAVFEDGTELGSTDETSVAKEIAEVEEDKVLTEEEIDGLSHEALAVELEKRGLEVPKRRAERVDALKAAIAE